MNTLTLSRPRIFNHTAGQKQAAEKQWWSIKNVKAEGSPVEICIYEQIGVDWWSGEGLQAKEFANTLKAIPKGTKILVRINSPGGSVWDGLLVYNLLNERSQDVTVRIDSLAASIASVIALAGHRLEMPRNGMMMIHDPWTVCQGNAVEMRKAAEMLDTHRDAICSVYEKKTRKSKAELEKAMAEETWFTGDEAKAYGFCDTVTDEISLQASFDLSRCKKAPAALKAGTNKKPSAMSGEQKGTHMDKQKIIALLVKQGVTVPDNATDEQLEAMLQDAMVAALEGKQKPAAKKKAKIEAGASESSEDGDDVGDDNDAPAPTNRLNQNNDLTAIQAQLKTVTDRFETERKTRITTAVEQCIADDKIPAAQRDQWVKRILADESMLADLQALTPRPPGGASVGVTITSEAPRDIERGLNQLLAPRASWLKGNDVDVKIISANARMLNSEIIRNRARLGPILATNTIDTALKRNVILSDLLGAFKRRLLVLSVFSTTWRNVPLEGTNKITVPYQELDTTASKDFVEASGYEFDGNTSIGAREITVDKRKYQPMDFSSSTFRRQPYFNPSQALMAKAEQLAVDVSTDVMSLIVAANFARVAITAEPSTWDVDTVIQIRKTCQNLHWPQIGRNLAVSPDHEAAILSDDALKHYEKSNSTDPLREGASGRLLGFNMYYPTNIPTNDEDLGGFACTPNAVLIAGSPIAPADGVRQTLVAYEMLADETTGIALEYRHGADTWKDKDREVIEFNYGRNPGNADALLRVQNGAATNSSSSSASSVNSSSSEST